MPARQWLGSFRVRLLAGFAIIIALSLFLSASGYVLLLREREAEAAEARIGLLVGPVTEVARNLELQGWPQELIRVQMETASRLYEIRILLLDRSGRVVIDTTEGQSLLGEQLALTFTEPVADPGPMPAFRTQRVNVAGEDLYLFTAADSTSPGQISSSTPLRQLVIAVPAEDVTAAWATLLPRLALAGAGAGVVAVIFATLFAARITTPLVQMTRASEAIAGGDLEQRIDVEGEDEVGRLATAFNLMSSRISRSDQAMRDLLANVSHELKTPLTSIQGFSQAIVDGLGDDPREAAALIHEEAERIRILLDDLIYLSEIESGTVRLEFEQVDVDELIEGALRRFRFAADEAGVDLRASLAAHQVRADGRRLEQVLANLLDNAIRFAPAGSAVTVSAREVAQGVLIEVHNGGEPIPADDLSRVFDRFYRVDRSRSPGRHRGLGLSIVQELVQAHGGSVDVESTVEQGTTFSVFLPSTPHSSATPHVPSEPSRTPQSPVAGRA